MVQKCKNCGEPIARFPIFKIVDNKKVLIWKNLFKMSWDSIILVVIVTALIVAYKHDTEICREVLEHPIQFCNESNACKVLDQNRFNIEPKPLELLKNESWGIS